MTEIIDAQSAVNVAVGTSGGDEYRFEGFGTATRGGYSGSSTPTIYKVTNLNASGSGSLAAALTASVPRIIIFEVSGTIAQNDYIWISNPYCTVAGQTAPSPGITLKGSLLMDTHDVIIQHIRVRTGDKMPGPAYDWRDALGTGESGRDTYNFIIDHCSISWATDENTGAWYNVHNGTWQWNIISECLNNSPHPSAPHSMGTLLGPESHNITLHHNLYAHNGNRNPLVGAYDATEIINNVVYNWQWNGTQFQHYSGVGGQYGNIVANYYKAGNAGQFEYGISLSDSTSPSKFYVHNNIGPTRTSQSQDDWAIVYGGSSLRSNTPTFTPTGVTTDEVFANYTNVLAKAGARSADRDSVDIRVVNSVLNGTGNLIDSQDDVGGWPALAENHVTLTVPSNPHGDDDGDGYTNLEEWLNGYENLVTA